MSRPLRSEEPGLQYHVMNRGIARKAIFLGNDDRRDFLVLLADARGRWGIEVHAFSLMSNHFHLLFREPEGRLNRAVRHLVGVCTQRFNRRHRRDGPLLRGRFRSRIVQSERYVVEVRSRHSRESGPRRKGPPGGGRSVDESHGLHESGATPRMALRWECSAVVRRRRQSGPAGVRPIRPRTGAWPRGSGRGEKSALTHSRRCGFPKERSCRLRAKETGGRREVPDRLRAERLSIDEMLAGIAKTVGVEIKELTGGAVRGQRSLPRSIAMLVFRERTAASVREIADRFGVSPASVATLCRRTRELVETNGQARKILRKVDGDLS